MTTAGKKLINWCRTCHHAIVRDGKGYWGHFADDDWAGPDSECPCAWQVLSCAPPQRKSRVSRIRGRTSPPAIYDEVPAFARGALVPPYGELAGFTRHGSMTGTYEPLARGTAVTSGVFSFELTEAGKAWVAAEILRQAGTPGVD